jgi:site-specific DNA recombinase
VPPARAHFAFNSSDLAGSAVTASQDAAADGALGRFEMVLVTRLDRFTRSLLDLLLGIQALEERSVSLKSMTEPYDTSTLMGRFMIQLLGMLAEWERGLIAERTSGGRLRTASAGKWNGGPPPYGYQVDEDGRLVIHPEEAEVVRRIFGLADAGESLNGIADQLTGDQVPSPSAGRGKPSTGRWHVSLLQRVLRSSVYLGCALWGKTKVLRRDGVLVGQVKATTEPIPFTVPALIEPEQFERVGQALAARLSRSRGNAKHDYVLTGLIRCACGAHYVGCGAHHGRHRYRCSSWANPPYCRSKILYDDALLAFATDRLRAALSHPWPLLNAIERHLRQGIEAQRPLEEERAALEGALAHEEARRQNVLDMFQDGVIPRAERETRLAAIDALKDDCRGQLARLTSRETQLQKLEAHLLKVQQFLETGPAWSERPEDLRHAFQQLGVQIRVETVPGEGRYKDAALSFHIQLDQLASGVFSLHGVPPRRKPPSHSIQVPLM